MPILKMQMTFYQYGDYACYHLAGARRYFVLLRGNTLCDMGEIEEVLCARLRDSPWEISAPQHSYYELTRLLSRAVKARPDLQPAWRQIRDIATRAPGNSKPLSA